MAGRAVSSAPAMREPASLLGLKLGTHEDVIPKIRAGFPGAALRHLSKQLSLTQEELASVIQIPVRSLARRLRGKLTHEQSDRAYRVARVFAFAIDTLGSAEKAKRWLGLPNRALGGVTPISQLDTEPGAREVENVLGHIGYGGVM